MLAQDGIELREIGLDGLRGGGIFGLQQMLGGAHDLRGQRDRFVMLAAEPVGKRHGCTPDDRSSEIAQRN
ncbi:hypothetical protein [Novosphingopyxis iocasae]|uniref:hypothetical protein n=1 Tax=Novosphingopyxis iocasae TaxID=2762729 RepID=UPI0016514555|nr:hypothetical protein [Novosphingopyxis iocasae]